MQQVGSEAAGGAPKTVMITGVSRGLGRVLALELARLGHTVIGCARSQDKILTLESEMMAPAAAAAKHLLTTVDVTSDSGIQELARLVVETKRVPDIIVNNAGAVNRMRKIWEVPAAEFDMVIDTNIKGTTNVLRHFLPLMIEKKQGIVVNMSSGWGRYACPKVAPYCASKYAIEGLTGSVSKEVPPGLVILTLNPGVVSTDMLVSCFGDSAPAPQGEALEAWAPRAATLILNLTEKDNGATLSL